MLVVAVIPTALPAGPAKESSTAGVLKNQFIFSTNRFPASHGSTLGETKDGLLAAWFSGPQARHPEVTLWISSLRDNQWSLPREVADGKQTDGSRYQCWNPVLCQPTKEPLHLFYKVGPNPEGWWGMLMTSTNQGDTWSKPIRLPAGFIGPVRNKPVELSDGTLLCGSSSEMNGWKIFMERLTPRAQWEKTIALNDPAKLEAIQPTILVHDRQRIQILCRTKHGRIAEAWSENSGRNWSEPITNALPNPNSAIDAIRLQDGRFLLVYNHSATERNELNLAVSNDGKIWLRGPVLEKGAGEFAYPAVIQTRDGLVHITYSWNRRAIKHAVVDPRQFKLSSSFP